MPRAILFAILSAVAGAVCFVSSVSLQAQESKGGPRESVFLQAGGGKRLTIEYNRPSMSGRKIMGGLVPYGKIWPIGGPARLTSEFDFAIGDVLIPEGTYSLFALPLEEGWKLVINKVYKAEAFAYDQKEDAGRFDMEVAKTTDPVERLTISLVPGGGGKGKMKIEWERISATLPFTVVSY